MLKVTLHLPRTAPNEWVLLVSNSTPCTLWAAGLMLLHDSLPHMGLPWYQIPHTPLQWKMQLKALSPQPNSSLWSKAWGHMLNRKHKTKYWMAARCTGAAHPAHFERRRPWGKKREKSKAKIKPEAPFLTVDVRSKGSHPVCWVPDFAACTTTTSLHFCSCVICIKTGSEWVQQPAK